MDYDSILELLKYGERINLECKKGDSTLPNSVWETYSAFANTVGGTILLGVEEHLKEIDIDKRFTFVSVQNPEQRIRDFWNTINSSKVNRNILKDSNVGTCAVNGATIIWIEVPQATYREKPIYINENPIKGSYKRNYEGDYHCTEEEVKAMLRDASDAGNDGGLLDGYTMDDIDVDSLRSYRIEFEHRNPEHIWNSNDDQTFLKNMGGYAVDRMTGRGWLTAAGLLMFGKGIAVRERFDNIRMDYIDESNLRPGSRWSDRFTYDGRWENNLYNFMRQVMPKLVSGLKRPFKLNGLVRVDDTPLFPHTINFLRIVNFDLLNQLVEHSGREFACAGVLSHQRDEHIRGHSLAALLLNFGAELFDFLRQFLLLVLIPSGHFRKTVVGEFAGNIVLIDAFKQPVQFLVTGKQGFQFLLLQLAVSLRRLLGVPDHRFQKFVLIEAGELRVSFYLLFNLRNLLYLILVFVQLTKYFLSPHAKNPLESCDSSGFFCIRKSGAPPE